VPTMATNGKDIFVNETFVRSLEPLEVDGLLLHEVLHAALLHCLRRGIREPLLWNIAADIVVNGMIAQDRNFQLPPYGIRNPHIEHWSAEEIYEILLKKAQPIELDPLDLLTGIPQDCLPGSSHNTGGTLDRSQRAELERHWRNAMQQAMTVARTSSQGSIPAGMQRELGAVTQAQLDWRSHLWRYLVKTPTDFSGFDRRFIGRGLYLETLEGESVQVFVAVDTSGSIGNQEMQVFLSEVYGIIQAYSHIKGELYYVDAEAYGPYPLSSQQQLPAPVGGGGTSFIPFFNQVNDRWDQQNQAICIYLTDGYGDFPEEPPPLPVLWVVTPGGLDLEHFPFGEAVRLLCLS
ncbi:MAG: vWA domain-containing protein, partial [Chroococcales cyanobacterium]